MFANTFQSGFISVFYSVGSNPLSLWDKQVKNGHIRRVIDDDIKSLVLEISGTNVATTYITCPNKQRASLGIRLPFLVMIIKNIKKYFTFEVQILDDKNMHRRFRVSNFQSTTKVAAFCTTMPIGLSSGWNQVQFNLADFTKRAYGSTYLETTRVQIHANVRIRRIYFADALYNEDELPNEFKLFLPIVGHLKTSQKIDPKRASESSKGKKEEKLPKVSEKEIPSGAPPSPVLTQADDLALTDITEKTEVISEIEAEVHSDIGNSETEKPQEVLEKDELQVPLEVETKSEVEETQAEKVLEISNEVQGDSRPEIEEDNEDVGEEIALEPNTEESVNIISNENIEINEGSPAIEENLTENITVPEEAGVIESEVNTKEE